MVVFPWMFFLMLNTTGGVARGTQQFLPVDTEPPSPPGVCFTSNDSNWGQLLPPTDGAELFLMVDCPGCSEHRFAMLQTPEPASLDV